MKRKQKKPLTITKLKEKIDDLLLEKLKSERGDKCELCGGRNQLGLFHVLSKGSHPRLRCHERNLLIAGWFCCHFIFHHDFYIARDRIIPKIKELLGEDYEEQLWALERTLPILDRMELESIYENLKAERSAANGNSSRR